MVVRYVCGVLVGYFGEASAKRLFLDVSAILPWGKSAVWVGKQHETSPVFGSFTSFYSIVLICVDFVDVCCSIIIIHRLWMIMITITTTFQGADGCSHFASRPQRSGDVPPSFRRLRQGSTAETSQRAALKLRKLVRQRHMVQSEKMLHDVHDVHDVQLQSGRCYVLYGTWSWPMTRGTHATQQLRDLNFLSSGLNSCGYIQITCLWQFQWDKWG